MSKYHVGSEGFGSITGKVTIPDYETLVEENLEDFRRLTITKVSWTSWCTLGFTLSNGETCKVGATYDFE
jgi:hypothetical protein